MMLYQKLYDQLTAIEALGVGREGPGLNSRGERILRFLRVRARRAMPWANAHRIQDEHDLEVMRITGEAFAAVRARHV